MWNFNSNRFFLFTFLILLFASVSMLSQVVYEPLHRDVYNYLRRLSQKGIVEFNDGIRPLPRKYIADKLNEAKKNQERLTSLEKEELEFFIKDLYHENSFNQNDLKEVKNLDYFNNDPAGRWRFFSYGDENFKFNASLILGYEIGSLDKAKRTHLWNGIYT